MNRKTKQKINGIGSKSLKVLFASSMVLALFAEIVVGNNSYYQAEAESSATASNIAVVNGVEVSLDQNLVDNNDGTYSMSLKTSSSLRYSDKSIKNTTAKYGYFKAKTTGDYLFEIWGGDGGSGENTRYSDGGKGGEGAHLYASLNMQAGEYIFYTIGGDGQQTVSTSTGGGANGDGGDHGDTGSYYVGGGGGFTAVYYFDKNSASQFEKNYLENGQLTRTDVLESDRVSKYIMIAGGGGGGGAGNAFSLSNKAVRTADGGSAGGLKSPSGVLSGSSYKVQGTFYSGSNGYSSGKNQDYIGKGGSNVPGEVNTTYFEWFNGKQPNDWEGASNPNYPGGSGGAGNLRGGAGGAGFAGGSGGIMAGLLLGYDVGGGGGGSSFIADKLNTELTENEKVFVSNYNESTTGGAVYITHVPDESAYTCLGDLTINGEISEYFDIVEYSSSKGTIALNNNKFTITHATSVPGTAITVSTETLLTMKLKPKSGLMGGNDVPVFANNSIKYDYVKDSTAGTFNIQLNDITSYVNLPYQFELVTNNYTGVCPDGGAYTEKKAKDLFIDNGYVSQKGTKGYAFIENVTDYTIKDEDGKTYNKEDTLSVTSTKKYYVSFVVTPKAGSKAIVGERLTEKTYEKEAKITIIDVSKNVLNGNEMSYTKTLNYNQSDNTYVLSVNVATSGSEYGAAAEFPYSSPGTGSYTVTTAGVYGLHAWGGNGGLGGDGKSGEEGMSGGSGGYYETKIYLDVGDVVTYSVGKNGSKGATASSIIYTGGQGTGGIRSEIYVNNIKMIVAGGGGGGGGGTAKSGQTAGGSCTELGEGTDGSPVSSSSSSTSSHKGGSAGTNYVNTAAIDAKNQGHDISSYQYRYTPASYSATGNSGGAVYIAPLAKNKTLSNYGVKADFTTDFNLIKVDISGADATKSDTNPEVKDIIPNDVVSGNTRYVDFTVTYTLTPNCLGGNDIQLLNALELNQVDCNGSTLDDKIDVDVLDSTDYANVKIDKSILDKFSLNTYEVDYVQGGDGVEVSSLVDGSTSFTPTDKIKIVPFENSFPSTEGKVNPDVTTEYVVNYGVRPTSAPTKAVVGPAVSEQVITGVSKVTVYHSINFNVSHMKIEAEKENIGGDDVFVYVPGKDYEAKLTPETGWDKPDDIKLTIDGVEYPEYIKENDDGSITLKIPGDKLTPTSNIQLTSNAKEKEYTIHYLVSLDANGITTKDHTVKAKAGEDITSKVDTLIAEYPPEDAPSIAGYTFTVEYPNGEKPTTMNAGDIWINGVYNPNPHTLTVHYVDMAGNKIAEDYVDPNTSCYFHKQYSLTPASVKGYAPNYVKIGSNITDLNAANPQFSMPDNDLEMYIYYIAVNGKAVINYVCQDDIDNLPETVIIDDKAPGEEYSVDSPIIPGYVASIATVSGQIQVDGEAVTVTYVPVSHTISFDSAGGTEFADRTVFYGHEVGYTGDSYAESTFEPLPTPVKIGYNFLGWYINNTKIDASSIWELDSDFTLKAKWEKRSYTVTIRYSYDDDSGVSSPLKNVVLTGLYDTTYSYTHQNVVGYTAPAMTTGTYGASNINVDVQYTINYHDIIVHYVDDNGLTLKADETFTNQKYGSAYEVKSTFDDDMYKAESPTTYTGNMPDNDLELTFIYSLKVIVVTEDNSEVTIKPKTGTEFVFGNEDNTPVVTVKVNDTLLTEGTDYDLVFPDPFDKDSAGEKNFQIKFKGNYSGTLDETYTVKSKQIKDGDLSIAPIGDQTYSGLPLEPKPEYVKDGSTTLELGKDYVVEYKNNTNKGTAEAIIKFIGNYAATGSKTVNFEIKAKDISDDVTVTGIPEEVTFNGTQYKPTPVVKYGDKELVEGTDYTVFYGDNTDAPEGSVTIRFIGNYEGTKDIKKTFVIKPVTMDKSKLVIGDIQPHTFDGKPYEPKPTVTYNGTPLKEGKDFEYQYEDNTHTPGGKVKIVFKGNYEGNDPVEKDFTISPRVVPEGGFDFDPSIDPYPSQEYTGEAIHPTVKIKDREKDVTLREGVDYTIECTSKDAGDGQFKIIFIGDYEGTDEITVPFTITPKSITGEVEVTGIPEEVTFNGTQYKPTPVVKYGDKTLQEGVDYNVTYGDNKDAGDGTVTIQFINNYEGTDPVVKTFKIKPATIDKTKLVVDDIPPHTFDGKPYEPKPDITYDGKPLEEGKDFIYKYRDNTNAPEGTLIIEFKGNYEGNDPVEIPFEINTKDVTGQVTVTLDPEESTYTGKQIKPDVTVENGTVKLKEKVDYVVIYGDNTDTPEGKVTIRFIGNYAGSEDVEKTFVIKPATIDKTKLVVDDIPPHTFDDQPYEPKPAVTYDGKPLKEGEDFEYQYEDNTHTPGGKVKIVFKGNYEGNDPVEKPFEIKPKQVPQGGFEIVPDINNYPPQPYTGEPIKPNPIIKDGDKVLEEGKDYIIHSDDKEIGPGEFTIEFINDYEGNDPIEVEYEIVPQEFDIVIPDVEYTGEKAIPHPIVKHDGETLQEGVDYTVSCDDTESGTGTAIIHFIGKYAGNPDLEEEFKILPKDASDTTTVTLELDETIETGKEIKPDVTVKDGDKVLEEGKDYIVLYTSNTNPGEAKANVIFIGNYKNTDPMQESFKIKAETLNNRKSATSNASVFLSFDKGFDSDITMVVTLKTKNEVSQSGKDQSKLGGRFYQTYGSYDIKLYKNGVEIQPSEIKEGAILTLKIAVPASISGADIKLVHIHSDEDISVISKGEQAGIGTYIIDEEGFIVTHINKLSDFSIIYETQCFAHWFLLAAAILDIILLAAIIIIGKKQGKAVGIFATTSLIVITAVSGIFAHCLFCYILLGINGGLVIANIIFFALFKGKEDNTTQQIVYVNAPAQPVQNTEETSEAEVTAEEPKEEPANDISLRDSMAQARDTVSVIAINKQTVADWLKNNFNGQVVVGDVKPALTSTGLPLADTHYTFIDGQKKCFIYVYEVDGKCFFIVRGDEELANEIKHEKHSFIKSAFPKTRDYAKWYTMFVDDSFKSSDEVFKTLRTIINHLNGVKAEIAPEVSENIVDNNLSLRDSMAQARDAVSDVTINKQTVADWLKQNYPNDVIVGNVKPALTSTGLPLADTHYIFISDDNKKCFIYVYDVDGKCFFIVRSDDDTAKEIRSQKHKFINSAFPKTRDYAKWYTMLIDDSYKSSNEVFETLKFVIGRLKGESVQIKKVEEPINDISLKESMAKAKDVTAEITISKDSIANWLKNNFNGQVVVGDVKPALTSTGLPLADTHYTFIDGQKKCFIYVYEVDGKCFFIVRGNDTLAKEIKQGGHSFIQSAFPKTRDYAKWYTMFVDSSYKSSNEVFNALNKVLMALNGDVKNLFVDDKPVINEKPVEAKQEENINEGLSLKESMKKSKENFSGIVVTKESVATYLSRSYGDVIQLNRRGNMTSTGLPLADTHYIKIGGEMKCFMYVYEFENKCFFIIKAGEEVAEQIRKKNHIFFPSAFPKTRDRASWYTMLFDNSYESNEELFETIDTIIDSY